MFGLNREQISIIKSTGDIFVKAGAGTGKTRTITELYFDLLFNRQYEIRNILAITFTEKAANEMKERIKQKIRVFSESIEGNQKKSHLAKLQKRVNYAWISTLHAFCSRILREFPLQSSVDPMFEIIDEAEKKRRIKHIVRNYFNESGGSVRFEKIEELAYLYRYDNLLLLFEEALNKKQYEVSKINFSKLQTKTDDVKTGKRIRQLLPEFKNAFNEMARNYQQENKSDNKLDYDGLIFETIKVLKLEDALREKLQKRFKCIIVDEFQDTNQQQKEIVDLLNNDQNKVVFVGDPKQSIYYFNGADVSVYNKTEKEFQNNEIFELFKNYRSNSELIEFFNLVFPKIFQAKPDLNYTVKYDSLSAEAKQIVKQPVKLLPIADSFEEECENISRYINNRVENGVSYKDFAILMRRMTKVEILEDALKRHKIPFYINGSRGFFKKPEIATLTAFLRAFFDPTDEENLLILLRSFVSPFSDSELVELRKENKKSLLKAWESYSERGNVNSSFYEQFVVLRNQANFISPSKLVRKIIHIFDYEFVISQLTNPTRRLLNLKKFLEFAQLFEGEISIRLFLKRIEGMENSNEGEASLENEKSNVVKIMTIHKSKGLEFPIVIVPELGYVKQSGRSKPNLLVNYETNEMSFKDPIDEVSGSDYSRMLVYEKAKEDEEEKRVLYVSFTRAERELILSYSKPSKNKKNACFRNALIACDILHEKDKDDLWKEELKSPVNQYLEIVKPSSLKNIVEKEINTDNYEGKIEKDIQIPKTVYALDQKEWKKYVSPTLLNRETHDINGMERYETIVNFDFDENKNLDRKTKGTLVHKVLEDLGNFPLSSITPNRIREKLAESLAFDDYFSDVKNIIKEMAAFKSPLITAIEKAEINYSEIPIRKKFGKYILTGTVDKLFLSEKVWKIVDFKYSSGSVQDDEDYAFQIRFYLYCLEKLLSPKPQKGYLYYIKSNQIVEVSQSSDIEQLIKNKIQSFEKRV